MRPRLPVGVAVLVHSHRGRGTATRHHRGTARPVHPDSLATVLADAHAIGTDGTDDIEHTAAHTVTDLADERTDVRATACRCRP